MLRYNPEEALEHLHKVDPVLGKWLHQAGEFALRITPISSPWEGLAESIVYQQLSGKAAATIYGRFRALFETADEHPTPEQVLALRDEQLRGVGLSQNKMLAIQDLARKTLEGIVPTVAQIQEMDDQAIKDALVQVRGIGEWTVEMVLIFNLGRPDVLPIRDLGVQKGFMRVFGTEDLPKPKALMTYGEKWKPFRSVASWYLWRAADTAGRDAQLVKE